MAGNENSGGFRPTAPQNNPANVNGLGGNGQSGTQALKPMTGLPWGTNQATEDIGRAAPLAGNPTAIGAQGAEGGQPQAPQKPLTDLFAPTELPDQHVSHGNDMQNLALPAMVTPQPEKAMQIVSALYMEDPTNQDLRYILESASDQGRI
jgi:hypothetical protein